MRKPNIYVDESGDEGFKIPAAFRGGEGSSRWFILAAAVVPAETDLAVSRSIDRIKSRLWPDCIPHEKVLHWTKLSQAQKLVVRSELQGEEFVWLAVLLDKGRLDRSKFDARIVRQSRPDLRTPLYNYAVRLLFERLCKMARAAGRSLDIVFENRASLSLEGIADYLNFLSTQMGPYGPPTIPEDVVAEVSALGKDARKMLQLADACAGSLKDALEPNRYGEVDQSHLMALEQKLRRHEGQLWGYGLKIFPGTHTACLVREPKYAWMKDL